MSVYNDLTPVLDSVPLRNAETWSDLIIFLLNLMTISSNTIQIALLDLQTESWDQLAEILSDFTTISRNLRSVATVFSIASSRPAMRNRAIIDKVASVIAEKSPEWKAAILKFKKEGGEEDVLSSVEAFFEYGLKTANYLMKKTEFALKIHEKHMEITGLTSKNKAYQNGFMLHLKTKEECIKHASTMHEKIETLTKIVEQYLKIETPSDLESCSYLLQFMISSKIECRDLDIDDINMFFNRGNVHLHVQVDYVMPETWGGIDHLAEEINKFLSPIVTLKMDERATAQQQASAKKDLVRNIIRDTKAEIEAGSDVFKMKSIIKELDALHQDFLTWSSHIIWTADNFGISREDLSDLKSRLGKKVIAMERQKADIEREKENIAKSLSKPKHLPKISQKNWGRWLRLYNGEKNILKSETSILNLIKNSLNQSDDLATEHFQDVESVMSWLHNKYGTPQMVVSNILEDLQQKSISNINEEKLIEIKNSLIFIQSEHSLNLFTPEIHIKIINNLFSEAMRKECLMELIKFRENLQENYSGNDLSFDEHYNSKTAKERLQKLIRFIDKQLQLLRAMNFGKQKTITRHAKVANKFSCPLCKSGHINQFGRARPYLSACENFLALNVEDRFKAVKRLSFCLVCLRQEKHSSNNCSLLSRLNCRCEHAARSPHHKLLCKEVQNLKNSDFRRTHKISPGSELQIASRNTPALEFHSSSSQSQPSSSKQLQNGKHKTNKSPINTCSSYFINFLKNLPLLLISLSTACDGQDIQSIKTKILNLMDTSWLEKNQVFQSCLMVTTKLHGQKTSFLSLSDSGATLNFCSSSLVKKFKLKNVGFWRGRISGINEVKEVESKVYLLPLLMQSGDIVKIICLETDKLGFYKPPPHQAIMAFGSYFGIDPNCILRSCGQIELLVGMSNSDLLLTKITSIDSKVITPPPWSPNTNLYSSPASHLVTLAGAIGKPDSCTINIVHSGSFSFFRDALEDIKEHYDPSIDFLLPNNLTSSTAFPITLSSELLPSLDLNKQEKLSNSSTDFFEDQVLWTEINQVSKSIKNEKQKPVFYSNHIKYGLASVICAQGGPPLHGVHGATAREINAISKEGIKNDFLSFNSTLETLENQLQPWNKRIPSIADLSHMRLCPDCLARTKTCESCNIYNSNLTLEKIREYNILMKSINVTKTDQHYRITVKYPLCMDIKMFSPNYSNHDLALTASKRLKKRLISKGIINQFHQEMNDAREKQHLEFLSAEESARILNHPHNFVLLNFVMKDSDSTPIRVVSNSSNHHNNAGSLNAALVQGPQLLGDILDILISISLSPFMTAMDLSKAYRSVYTHDQSNNLRLFCYWDNIQDPNEVNLIGRFTRMNFGDSPSASLLEIILRFIIADKCKTELARVMLQRFRYVDDIIAGANSKQALDAAVEDLEHTLKIHGFQTKHSFKSYENYEQTTVNFLHLTWFIKEDKINIMQKFNVYRKIRGKYAGPDLVDMSDDDIYKIKITKTILSRLLGQQFDPLGLLGVIRGSLLYLFSDVCAIAETWDQVITDHELIRRIHQTIIDIKVSLPLIQTFPRSKLPLNSKLESLFVFSDSSWKLIAYNFYVLYSLNEKLSSHLLFSSCLSRSASVPTLELMAHVAAMEKLLDLFTSHASSLLHSHAKSVQIYVMLDSKCTLYHLSPLNVSRSIIVKNSKDRSLSISKHITKSFNQVQIYYGYIDTSSNPADLSTKSHRVPLSEVINSNLWRKGTSSDYLVKPCDNDLYMRVSNGLLSWLKEPSNISFIQEQFTYDDLGWSLAAEGTETCQVMASLKKEQDERIKTAAVQTAALQWEAVLDLIPPLGERYTKMLNNHTRSFHVILRSISLTVLCYLTAFECPAMEELYHNHGWSPQAFVTLLDPEDQLGVVKGRKHRKFKLDVIPPRIMRLAFLLLVKQSNKKFKPKSKLPTFTISDITFMKTRYSSTTMSLVFGSEILPVVSAEDKDFSKKIIESGHLLDDQNQCMAVRHYFHLPSENTMDKIKSNKLAACVITDMRRAIQNYILNCSKCRMKDASLGKLRTYSWPRRDPLAILGLESLDQVGVFRHISIDTVKVEARPWVGHRRTTVPLYILFVCDVDTSFVTFKFMEDCSAIAVATALNCIFWEFAKPKRISSDHASYFKKIIDDQMLGEIEWDLLPAHSQFENQVENSLRVLKRITGQISRLSGTTVQLLNRISMAVSILNIRPSRRVYSGIISYTLSPRQLLFPLFKNSDIEKQWLEMIKKINNHHNIDIQGICNPNQDVLIQTLLQYLRKDSVFKYSLHKGYGDDRLSVNLSELLFPRVDDIVLVRQTSEIKLGRIVNIDNFPSRIKVDMMMHNTLTTKEIHTKNLGLLFRKHDKPTNEKCPAIKDVNSTHESLYHWLPVGGHYAFPENDRHWGRSNGPCLQPRGLIHVTAEPEVEISDDPILSILDTLSYSMAVESGREPGAHQEVEVPLDLEEEDLYPFLDTQFII